VVSRGESAREVSVLIPVYNHERFVRSALESVLAQSAPPGEIICIDDGSGDRSAAVVADVARRSDRIRAWSRPNRGAAATLNEAARAAKGSVLAILNSDDLYMPHRLARAVVVLEADERVAAVASDLVLIDQDGNELEERWQAEATAFYRATGALGLALVNGNFLRTTSNLVVRRETFEELGGFDDLRYAHDLHFFLRLVSSGKRMTILKDKLLCYRLHATNTISEAHSGVRAEWAAVSAFYARDLLASGSARATDEATSLFRILEKHRLSRAVEGLLVAMQFMNGTAVSPSVVLRDRVSRSRVTKELEMKP
jgi:glycosyltransferase involved in cell wall biosynthesis